jgi:hypothetical protein
VTKEALLEADDYACINTAILVNSRRDCGPGHGNLDNTVGCASRPQLVGCPC